jgi:hypothetical protein
MEQKFPRLQALFAENAAKAGGFLTRKFGAVHHYLGRSGTLRVADYYGR